jgi:hypothetical protein
MRTANQLVDRRAVAVGAVEMAVAIPAEAEGIHLTVSPGFDAGTIRAEAEDIAAVEFERAAVLSFEVAGVIKPMRGIHPAIQAEAEAAAHAVGVFFITERAEDHFADIGFVVAIGVGEVPDVRDAPGDAARFVLGLVPGLHARGDVQSVGEVGDFVGFAITVGVFEDLDGIAAVFDASSLRIGPTGFVSRVGVLDGAADPEPTARIEGHVDRLIDHRLTGEELDLKARQHMQRGLFLLRRECGSLADETRVGLGCHKWRQH